MSTPLKLAYIAPLTSQAVALVVTHKAAQGLSRIEAPKRTGLYLLLTGCAVAILSVLLLQRSLSTLKLGLVKSLFSTASTSPR